MPSDNTMLYVARSHAAAVMVFAPSDPCKKLVKVLAGELPLEWLCSENTSSYLRNRSRLDGACAIDARKKTPSSFLTRQGASPLDIPQAGYGSQESGARSQNGSGVAAQQPARFLQRTRQRLGVAVAKILAQNQVVTTLFY